MIMFVVNREFGSDYCFDNLGTTLPVTAAGNKYSYILYFYTFFCSFVFHYFVIIFVKFCHCL